MVPLVFVTRWLCKYVSEPKSVDCEHVFERDDLFIKLFLFKQSGYAR